MQTVKMLNLLKFLFLALAALFLILFFVSLSLAESSPGGILPRVAPAAALVPFILCAAMSVVFFVMAHKAKRNGDSD